MVKRRFRFMTLAFLLIGVFFLFNSKTGITGALVGFSYINSYSSSIIGFIFIIGALILFTEGDSLEDKIKMQTHNPRELEKGRRMDFLEYRLKKEMLFEKKYIVRYPPENDESYDKFRERLRWALEHQSEYPDICEEVNSQISKIRRYVPKTHTKDFLTELRRVADEEIREAYFEKYVTKRKGVKRSNPVSKYENDLYKTEHYKIFREKVLKKIKQYNENVKSGIWGLIDIQARNLIRDKKFSDDSYSQILYFGPKEVREEIDNIIKTNSTKSVRKLLAQKARIGEIGEAHMIANRDNYSHWHWEIRNISRDYLL